MVRRFHLPSIFLGCVIAGLVGGGWESVARAQAGGVTAPATGAARSEGAVAERQRLRGQLQRVQAEIDQLKKAGRGLRTDYQLRARMADAEALARRLTELDALVKPAPHAGSDTGGPAGVFADRVVREPAAAPSDGPAELEAKADILADQSRRVKLQIGALKARFDQLRGRQELKRRAHQLDNDPFAPLEGSKRRMVTVSPTVPAAPGPQAGTTDHAPAVTSLPPPGAPLGGAAAIKTPSSPTPATLSPTPTPTSSPSVQLHDLLDPATLAQIRKVEQDGSSPSSDLDSIQLALSALTARAQHLDAQSNLLRARARAR